MSTILVMSRRKCSGFFDFSCHIQYICLSWMVMFGLLLAIFPTVVALLWLLHQKGLFDPLYDWWEDHFCTDERSRYGGIWNHELDTDFSHIHFKKRRKQEVRHDKQHDSQRRRRNVLKEHVHNHLTHADSHYYLHQVQKDRHRHGKTRSSHIMHQARLKKVGDDNVGHQRQRKERNMMEGFSEYVGHIDENREKLHKHKHALADDARGRVYAKRRE